jgi:hypothetical protein
LCGTRLRGFVESDSLEEFKCAFSRCELLHCMSLCGRCEQLHCIALHCIALHCISLHCIALHCNALHCIALHCIALHCIALHCIALHCITPHHTTSHHTTSHHTTSHVHVRSPVYKSQMRIVWSDEADTTVTARSTLGPASGGEGVEWW